MSPGSEDTRRRIAEIGEFRLLAHIRSHLERRASRRTGLHVLGIGDDAALLRPPDDTDLAVTTDVQIAGRHFLPHVMSPRQVGWRAMQINLSDLAAMGAHPQSIFVSLGLHPEMELGDILALYDGFLNALEPITGAAIAGGNLTATNGPWFCDITAVGSLPRGQALQRGTAKAGDLVFVSGFPGSSAAGLALLGESLKAPPSPGSPGIEQSGSGEQSGPGFGSERARVREWLGTHSWAESLIQAYLEPVARLELGQHLRENDLAHAACDLSDGLYGDLLHICEASGVGARIDARTLPRSASMATAADHFGHHDVEWILGASDDYELLFTASPNAETDILACGQELSLPLHVIGVCIEDGDRSSIEVENLPRDARPGAWDHFEARDSE